jgi:hypothetical protein
MDSGPTLSKYGRSIEPTFLAKNEDSGGTWTQDGATALT